MKYRRIYSDETGESHIDESEVQFTSVNYAPPAPPLDLTDPVVAERYIFVRFAAGWDSPLHPTPRRQLFVVLSGVIEGAASDGQVMRVEPGDVVLMEDTSGKGHTAKVIGDSDVHAMFIHLE